MTKFYQEDIVQRIDDSTQYGVVLRCWHDPDDIPPPVGFEDPLLRALQPGEVGVSFFPCGRREILLESQFQLVDRTLQVGDVCKRNHSDAQSGIVVRADIKACLEHAISGEPLDEWKDTSEIRPAMDVEMGDYVVYDEWVGQVIELFDETLVELGGGQLVRMPELSARLTIGEKGNDIIPQPVSGMPGFFGFFHAPSGNLDTVVSMNHTVIAVSWLAINQSLDPEDAELRQRPQRIWYGEDLSKLTLVRNRSDTLRVGEKVLLKNDEGVPFTIHGKEGEPNGVVEVRHFVVRNTRTTVTVLWQDNVKETIRSTELIPYLNPDEYDCWPGDPVVWKGDNETRPAIVQSVNSAERTAYVRYVDTPGLTVDNELTSLLELDPHGTHDSSAHIPLPDDLGVHRGDSVFIHRPGTTNCAPKLRVPRIGELEAWVRELPTFHPNGQLGGWRREMSDVGAAIASARSMSQIHDGFVQRPKAGDMSFNWFGEVTDLRTDGSVEVTLPDNSAVVLPLERLTRLHDGLEQLEDFWGDEISEDHASMDGVDGLEVWDKDGDVHWHASDLVDADDWEDEGSVTSFMDVDQDLSTWDGNNTGQPPLPVSFDGVVSESTTSTPMGLISPPSSLDQAPLDESLQGEVGGVESSNWKRFEILSSVPVDHAFYDTVPMQPSRTFLGRLTKEYRALSSSLPDSIVVRAYEDRTDLLRSLIIGPENTPYEDAPFVIDWKLEPDFPITPPTAHFMSWTNGNGRVNPNLYEDGKVCLSILGTWAGDKNETWSASRSSLLQAFVSIQGLVLVKEPYFCEPAYEKFRQTEEGTVNSRLYNEKAYVLARGFIVRALELRLGGLESELDWLYFSNGTLDKVLHSAEALVERSKTHSGDSRDLAVPRLTAGGVISLQRVLGKLKSIRSSRNIRDSGSSMIL